MQIQGVTSRAMETGRGKKNKSRKRCHGTQGCTASPHGKQQPKNQQTKKNGKNVGDAFERGPVAKKKVKKKEGKKSLKIKKKRLTIEKNNRSVSNEKRSKRGTSTSAISRSKGVDCEK